MRRFILLSLLLLVIGLVTIPAQANTLSDDCFITVAFQSGNPPSSQDIPDCLYTLSTVSSNDGQLPSMSGTPAFCNGDIIQMWEFHPLKTGLYLPSMSGEHPVNVQPPFQ